MAHQVSHVGFHLKISSEKCYRQDQLGSVGLFGVDSKTKLMYCSCNSSKINSDLAFCFSFSFRACLCNSSWFNLRLGHKSIKNDMEITK